MSWLLFAVLFLCANWGRENCSKWEERREWCMLWVPTIFWCVIDRGMWENVVLIGGFDYGEVPEMQWKSFMGKSVSGGCHNGSANSLGNSIHFGVMRYSGMMLASLYLEVRLHRFSEVFSCIV